MEQLKNRIIDKIISILLIKKGENPEEINTITNDLINYKTDSLIAFITKNYQNLFYSAEIIKFVKELVANQIIDAKYLEMISNNEYYELLPNEITSAIKISSRPLNVKEPVFEKLQNVSKPTMEETSIVNTEIPTPENTNIEDNKEETKTDEYQEITYGDIWDSTNIEPPKTEEPKQSFTTNKDYTYKTTNDIDSLRKRIMETQLNYIDDATSFIQNLEEKNVYDLYDILMDLNDIRFIQHSLSKLSEETLEKLLTYVQEKYNNNRHTSIDLFIIEVIKKNLHRKML